MSLIFTVVFYVLPIWFFWRAVEKAGLAPAWALLGLIPFVNVIMLWLFAYAKWPALPDR